jgi:hypothetical protein
MDDQNEKNFLDNLNFNKKILFIHVPKCGGNFIKNIIGGFGGDSHRRCSEIPDSIFKKFYSLSFVRNPWSRVLSAYNYISKSGNMGSYDRKSKIKYLSNYSNFNEFIQKGGLNDANISQMHFKNQSYFLDKKINYIGKIENFKTEVSFLHDILGNNIDISKYNPKPYNNYQKFYERKSIDIVYEVYKEDVLRFNYDF